MKVRIAAKEAKEGIDKEAKKGYHESKRERERERIAKKYPLGRWASFRCYWTWPFGHKYGGERDRNYDLHCVGCQRTRW